MIEKMSQLPLILRQTLTWEQSGEMSNHAQIAAATDALEFKIAPI